MAHRVMENNIKELTLCLSSYARIVDGLPFLCFHLLDRTGDAPSLIAVIKSSEPKPKGTLQYCAKHVL
jgi:uncharacterized protein YdaL